MARRSNHRVLKARNKILYTLIYVLPLYFSAKTRPSPRLSRDAPSVIRARVRVVTYSCVVCSLVTAAVLVGWTGAGPAQALRLLGYWPFSPVDVARVVLLTAILFAGPLFERGVVEGAWRDWIRGRYVRQTLGSWTGWRNLVAGPITEEMVFRSALVPLHLGVCNLRPGQIVFLTPLYFGIAHVHHFYEFTRTHPDTPLLPALIRSLVQFTYTSIFGFYATFVFLRTRSLPAVILAHSLCNWCGLPRVWGQVQPGVPFGPPALERKRHGREQDAAAVKVGTGQSFTLWWTVAYYILLVAGAVGFQRNLWPLTRSTLSPPVL